MNHHWAFLRKFENFVPFQAANSIGFPSCGRLNWAFSEEFFIFVPFSPVSQPRIWQEKGTKNQEMAGKRPNGRNKEQENRRFPALQGNKFSKSREKRPNHDPQAFQVLKSRPASFPNT
jgi:hypothetical protein